MNILMAHNYYQQPGGEDQIFAAEADLLDSRGHRVVRFVKHNERVEEMSRTELARKTVWNGDVYREIRELIREEGVEVAHFHNTFPLISPAAYHAARAEGVPVVQTLHNYRLLCPNALFFRDGHVCEDCLGKKVPWPGVVHACYRDSRPASGLVAAMLSTHRALRTWTGRVDVYIAALSGFGRRKFIEGGVPEEQIVLKPNFVPDPGPREGLGGYAVFVGRLSTEKGLETLIGAWERLGGRVPLKIVGDGPLSGRVQEAASRMPGVEWLGRRSQEEVHELLGGASLLVFPSAWYEGMPRILLESLAVGTPVIASNLGAMSEMVSHGSTGLHFRAEDPGDLAEKVAWAFENPGELARMRHEARAEYESRYTAERNYSMLMDIYRYAAERARSRT